MTAPDAAARLTPPLRFPLPDAVRGAGRALAPSAASSALDVRGYDLPAGAEVSVLGELSLGGRAIVYAVTAGPDRQDVLVGLGPDGRPVSALVVGTNAGPGGGTDGYLEADGTIGVDTYPSVVDGEKMYAEHREHRLMPDGTIELRP